MLKMKKLMMRMRKNSMMKKNEIQILFQMSLKNYCEKVEKIENKAQVLK